MEECLLSDCEFDSDESFDLYIDEPTFETKEQLEEFMESCNLQRKNPEEPEDEVCYELQKDTKKECSCNMCEDIWSHGFQHICCQQIDKYEHFFIIKILYACTFL